MSKEYQYEYSYHSDEQLKLLIEFLTEQNIELKVVLKSRTTEEYDSLAGHSEHSDTPRKLLEIPERNKLTGPAESIKKPDTLVELAERLLELTDELKVLPFTSLECKYYWGQGEPELKHDLPVVPQSESEYERITELIAKTAHPEKIMKGYRPYIIRFEEARKPHHIRIVKEFIRNISTEQYHFYSLHVGLNPQDYTRNTYYDGTEFDASLFTWKNKINIHSKTKLKKDNKLLEKIVSLGFEEEKPKLTHG